MAGFFFIKFSALLQCIQRNTRQIFVLKVPQADVIVEQSHNLAVAEVRHHLPHGLRIGVDAVDMPRLQLICAGLAACLGVAAVIADLDKARNLALDPAAREDLEIAAPAARAEYVVYPGGGAPAGA